MASAGKGSVDVQAPLHVPREALVGVPERRCRSGPLASGPKVLCRPRSLFHGLLHAPHDVRAAKRPGAVSRAGFDKLVLKQRGKFRDGALVLLRETTGNCLTTARNSLFADRIIAINSGGSPADRCHPVAPRTMGQIRAFCPVIAEL